MDNLKFKIETKGRIVLGNSKIETNVYVIEDINKSSVIISCGGIESHYSEIKDDGKRVLLYHGPSKKLNI